MTTTTTIMTSNANANAADKKKDGGREERDGQEEIPRDGLPTRMRDG